MNIQKTILTFLLALALVGCVTAQTPKIHLNSSEMAMEITSKVPVVTAAGYAPDGKSVATGGFDKTPRLWDLANAREMMKFKEGHTSAITNVVFSPDGKKLAVAETGGLTTISDHVSILWDVATGKVVRKFTGNFGGKLSFSPNGEYILGNNQKYKRIEAAVKLMDVQKGAVIYEIEGNEGKISPDGKYVAVLIGEKNKGRFFAYNVGSIA